jgi:hypothetical protein
MREWPDLYAEHDAQSGSEDESEVAGKHTFAPRAVTIPEVRLHMVVWLTGWVPKACHRCA